MLKKNEPKRNLSLTLVFDYFDGSLVDTYRGCRRLGLIIIMRDNLERVTLLINCER